MASLFVGLMSGTSLDGADAALVDFSSEVPRTLAFATVPFSNELREKLLALSEPGKDSLELAGRVSLEGGPKQVPFQAWARADGSFQEVSLDGSVLEPDKPTTVTFYGSPVLPKDILQDQAMVAPKAAQPLVRLASELAKRTS